MMVLLLSAHPQHAVNRTSSVTHRSIAFGPVITIIGPIDKTL